MRYLIFCAIGLVGAAINAYVLAHGNGKHDTALWLCFGLNSLSALVNGVSYIGALWEADDDV